MGPKRSARRRLRWLVEVAPTNDAAPAPHQPSRRGTWSNHILGRALQQRIGLKAWWVWAAQVARLRYGGDVHPAVLRQLAQLLDAPRDFFELERHAVDAAAHRLVDRAVVLEGSTALRRCRGWDLPASIPERIMMLRAIRSTAAAARAPGGYDLDTISSPPVAEPCHDDDPSRSNRHDASSGSGAERRGMTTHVSERDLERLCLDLLTEHQLALPLDPWELCRRLAARRRRPIRVVAADLGGPHSVGHLIAFPDRDTILYDAAAPRPQQVQVICHEVVHLVRGHLEDQTDLNCGGLLPSVAATESVGGANLYADWKEWEAEFGASILAQLVRARPDPSALALVPDEAGLAAAFGLTRNSERRGER